MRNRLTLVTRATRLLTLCVLSVGLVIGATVLQTPTARADNVYCGWPVLGAIEAKYLQ